MPLVLPTTPAPDLVVVSSDGVRYAVHSARLASQSAFFKDMLEIADPANLPTEPVAFAEPSSVVEILLDLIYGDGESEALVDADADTLISVGMAADKYVVDERITRKLSSALVYAAWDSLHADRRRQRVMADPRLAAVLAMDAWHDPRRLIKASRARTSRPLNTSADLSDTTLRTPVRHGARRAHQACSFVPSAAARPSRFTMGIAPSRPLPRATSRRPPSARGNGTYSIASHASNGDCTSVPATSNAGTATPSSPAPRGPPRPITMASSRASEALRSVPLLRRC